MQRYLIRTGIVCVIALLCSNVLIAQGLLDNDTLYIGSVTGVGGQQIIVPVYIRTSANYQGWQMPIDFGSGQSPVQCDSVSTIGTIMENWSFQAPFTNNNEWDNDQSCGIAGLVDFAGGSIPPGYYQVMKMYFTIETGASAGIIPLDTTTSRWYDGGPLNSYIVTVGGTSYITHVVQGAITIEPHGLTEHELVEESINFDVFPTIVNRGDNLTFAVNAYGQDAGSYKVYDVCGRVIDRIPVTAKQILYSTETLSSGVYYINLDNREANETKKIVVR